MRYLSSTLFLIFLSYFTAPSALGSDSNAASTTPQLLHACAVSEPGADPIVLTFTNGELPCSKISSQDLSTEPLEKNAALPGIQTREPAFIGPNT